VVDVEILAWSASDYMPLEKSLLGVAEQMNELIIEVERAAPSCALAVQGSHGRASCTLHESRSSVFLLSSATSSSMFHGDSKIECLCEELANGTFDDDDRVFLPRVMFVAFLIEPCCTNSQTTLTVVSCH
jgi:hypothetical protein